jgi:hypothetical protein
MRRRVVGALDTSAALLSVSALVAALTVATLAEAAGSAARVWPVVAFVTGLLLALEWAARLVLAPAHFRRSRGAVLDGLAAASLLLPTTRIPALALLRLLRLWTLVRRGDRYLAHRRRGQRTLLIACGVVGCTVICGTAAILVFERGQNPTLAGFDHALWFSFYSLFAQEPGDRAPYTLGGHLATLGMMFTGLGTFAVLTGTVSALVTERIRSPELYVDWEDLREHLHGSHLEMGNVNDYVVAGEHSAFLLAQGALNRGMVGLFTELFSRSAGNRLCHAEVGACWKGRSFFDLFVHLKATQDAILVAVEDGSNTVLNPHTYELRGGERVVLIAAHDVKLDRLPEGDGAS